MKRFTYESNPPWWIHDGKTGEWLDPHDRHVTIKKLLTIVNDLQKQNDTLIELLRAIQADKPSMRTKIKKRVRKFLKEIDDG